MNDHRFPGELAPQRDGMRVVLNQVGIALCQHARAHRALDQTAVVVGEVVADQRDRHAARAQHARHQRKTRCPEQRPPVDDCQIAAARGDGTRRRGPGERIERIEYVVDLRFGQLARPRLPIALARVEPRRVLASKRNRVKFAARGQCRRSSVVYWAMPPRYGVTGPTRASRPRAAASRSPARLMCAMKSGRLCRDATGPGAGWLPA